MLRPDHRLKLLAKPDAVMAKLPKSSSQFRQLSSIVWLTALLMNDKHSGSFAARRALSAMAMNVRKASKVDAALTHNAPGLRLAVH